MGAAVGAIDGARAVEVPRSRFAPVKTTDDLLARALRRLRAAATTARSSRASTATRPSSRSGPTLRRLDDFEAHFAGGLPSLRGRAAFTVRAAFGPGRVNLIGEHTDYNGGLALPFAIAQGVTVTATPIDGDEVVAIAHDLGEEDRFALAAPPRAEGWRAFVRGVVAELGRRRGACGWTSPATCRRARGCRRRRRWRPRCAWRSGAGGDRVELARLCSRVENDWAGANTGLLDQLASLLGRAGHALRIDFRTLDVTPVALDLGDWTLVTVDSGEPHSHADSGYNERRAECAQACAAAGRRDAERRPGRRRAARRPRAPPAPRAHRERARRGDDRRARGTATWTRSARCSTPPTPACATTTRRPPTPSSAPSRRCATPARRARGWSAAASAATSWRCCAPGTALPDGATVVTPSAGARVL